jgi:hypothetical protein
MISGVVFGTVVVVISLLAFWQRERLAQMNTGWNKRLGKPGGYASSVGTAKYFGIGAVLMALCGAATIVYSLVTGSSPLSNSTGGAVFVIIVAALLFVILGIVSLLMYVRSRK